MTTTEITAKVRKLKKLQAKAEELNAEIKAIQDEIKAEMAAQNAEEIKAGGYKIRALQWHKERSVSVRYIGTYTQREQAQRQAAYSRLDRYIRAVRNVEYLGMLISYCTQLQHIESKNASRAEQLRHDISVWTMYHDDIEELKDMFDLVVMVATRKARQAQRAEQQAKRAREFAQAAAKAAQTA